MVIIIIYLFIYLFIVLLKQNFKGYYGDTSSNECKVCSSSCLTCSGGGGADCLTCKDGFVLSAAKGKSGACRGSK